MKKNIATPDTLVSRFEQRFMQFTYETTKIRASFDRIRAEQAQEVEQKSRPAARIYSGMRAVKA
jgi:hypothetical protein